MSLIQPALQDRAFLQDVQAAAVALGQPVCVLRAGGGCTVEKSLSGAVASR